MHQVNPRVVYGNLSRVPHALQAMHGFSAAKISTVLLESFLEAVFLPSSVKILTPHLPHPQMQLVNFDIAKLT